MLKIIESNIDNAPKTLHCLVWGKITNGIKLNGKEYKNWPKIKGDIERFELIENGCVIYYLSGSKKYYKNGKIHRDNGPAVICISGYKAYYKNGKIHNDNGPAIIRSDGSKSYYKNGQFHRENGPARILTDGYREYWKNGVYVGPA